MLSFIALKMAAVHKPADHSAESSDAAETDVESDAVDTEAEETDVEDDYVATGRGSSDEESGRGGISEDELAEATEQDFNF